MQNNQNSQYNQYLAIDWSHETAVLASMHYCGRKVKVISMVPSIKVLKEHLRKYSGRKILAIEETTTSHWLYVELIDSVDKILICDPYRNHLLGEGAKTDKIDAQKLCLLLRNGLLKEVYHSLNKVYDIRKLISAYIDFVKSSVRFKNQHSAILRAYGKNNKKEKILKNNIINKFITEKQTDMIKNISEIRNEFESIFSLIAREHKIIRQLMKISGIGLKTAVIIYAIVVDGWRFENKYKYWAYCGLVKYQKESGGRNYGSKVPRYSRQLKSCYKTAALAAISGRNDIREYYDHMVQNGYSIKDAQNQISRYLSKVSYAIMKYKTDYRAYQWRESIS
jgi:transposase